MPNLSYLPTSPSLPAGIRTPAAVPVLKGLPTSIILHNKIFKIYFQNLFLFADKKTVSQPKAHVVYGHKKNYTNQLMSS